MKTSFAPKTAANGLEKLLKSGTLWSGSPNKINPIKPSSYDTDISSVSPTCTSGKSTYFSDIPSSEESIDLKLSLRFPIQEIFLETGIENKSKNLWFPAYGFVCENLKNILAEKGITSNISVAWICNELQPNLGFLQSSNLEDMMHIIFTPSKSDAFGFLRKTIKANCFSVVVACVENLSFSQTRSLKLISKDTDSINFLLRPPWEKEQCSATSLKYLVKPAAIKVPSKFDSPRIKVGWNREIIKGKPSQFPVLIVS